MEKDEPDAAAVPGLRVGDWAAFPSGTNAGQLVLLTLEGFAITGPT